MLLGMVLVSSDAGYASPAPWCRRFLRHVRRRN